MTQREEFENKIKAIDELFGITRNLKHDVDTDNYFDAPTNSAYMWFKLGWKAAKSQAVPESAIPVLLWVLAKHQGGKSDIGQPIRKLLGIGQHDALTKEQFDTATLYGKQINKPIVTPFELPERMYHELEGDRVADSHANAFCDGYNQCLSEVIALMDEAENKNEHA